VREKKTGEAVVITKSYSVIYNLLAPESRLVMQRFGHARRPSIKHIHTPFFRRFYIISVGRSSQ
jgi:hypothetical protein